MRKLLFISLLAMLSLSLGCNNTISKKEAKVKLEKLLKIPISDSIKITDYQTSFAISGDFTEVFVVHFKKKEFDKIFKEVKPGKFENININTDEDIYGYTIRQNDKMTSAIFDPQRNTIKYTCNYE